MLLWSDPVSPTKADAPDSTHDHLVTGGAQFPESPARPTRPAAAKLQDSSTRELRIATAGPNQRVGP